MLGTTKLQTFFGAVRPGYNTSGSNRLESMLKAYASEGLSILFLSSDPAQSKIPTDYRTTKRQKDMEAEALARGEKVKKGWALSSSDPKILAETVRNARKIKGNSTIDGQPLDYKTALGGLEPINFGLVPDRSKLVVVDCDTEEENHAFKNFFSDHTDNQRLRDNMDSIRPSVLTPGSVRGGTWNQVQEGYFATDFDTPAYIPPVYENHNGTIVHANGGHWYFFYPEDNMVFPKGTKSKVTVVYDATDRGALYENIRQIKDQIASLHNDDPEAQDKYNTLVGQLNKATEELDQVRAKAREDFESGTYAHTPKQDRSGLGLSAFTIMIHSCCVSIPPSSRFEGHYEIGSGEFQWENWLSSLIVTAGETATQQVNLKDFVVSLDQSENSSLSVSEGEGEDLFLDGNEGSNESNNTPSTGTTPDPSPTHTPEPPRGEDRTPRVVEEPEDTVDGFAVYEEGDVESLNEYLSSNWSWKRSWGSILEDHGWVYTGRDMCGCEIFEAPGEHSSPKSATAHDIGCSEFDTSSLGRLHIWTDNPPEEFVYDVAEGRRDFTKMTVLAKLEYDGNVGAAMRAEGLSTDLPAYVSDNTEEFNSWLANRMNVQATQDYLAAENTTLDEEILEFVSYGDLGDEEPPRYIIEDTLEANSFSAIIGAPGTGKSFIAIDIACSLVTGTSWLGHKCRKLRVAYLAGEGRSGVIDRMKSWEEVKSPILTPKHRDLLKDGLYLASFLPKINRDPANYAHLNKLVFEIQQHQTDLIVIDTWSRAIAGADENDAGMTSDTIDLLNKIQRITGCSILVIHHTTKGSDSARGSSAFNGALDTEMLIHREEDPEEGKINSDTGKPNRGRQLLSIVISKQKNAEPWSDPQYCMISKLGEDEDVTYDEDGFKVPGKRAPVAIADMDGNFYSNEFDGFGGQMNWTLETTGASRAGLPSDLDVLTTISRIVRENGNQGLTRAKVESLTRNEFAPAAGEKPNPKMQGHVTRLVSSAIDYKLVLSANNKLVPPRENSKERTPNEVATMLAEAEKKK